MGEDEGTCESREGFAARRAGEVRGCRGQSLAGTGEFGGAISIDRRWTMRRDERTFGKGPVREQHRARTGIRGQAPPFVSSSIRMNAIIAIIGTDCSRKRGQFFEALRPAVSYSREGSA